jgi:hypothetical protein
MKGLTKEDINIFPAFFYIYVLYSKRRWLFNTHKRKDRILTKNIFTVSLKCNGCMHGLISSSAFFVGIFEDIFTYVYELPRLGNFIVETFPSHESY